MDGENNNEGQNQTQHNETQHNQQNQKHQPTKSSNSRGASVGKKVKKISQPMFLEFDEYGQPCGKWKSTYSSQVGVLGRGIDINISDWHLVERGLKETIWLDLKKLFNIDDKWQAAVIRHVGTRWTTFKSDLTNKYVFKNRKQNRKEPLDDPKKLYEFTPAQWEKFKKSRDEPDFKNKRKAAQDAQKFNEHPHYLGSAGYSGKREKWFHEEVAAATSTGADAVTAMEYANTHLSNRSINWVKAHTPSNGKSPLPKTQAIFDKIDDLREKAKRGEFVANGRDDILTVATNKRDHTGRVRGVGSRVGVEQVWGKTSSSSTGGRMFTDEQLDMLVDKVKKETLKEMFEYLKRAGVTIPSEDEIDNTPKSVAPRSSCHSIDPFAQEKGPISCQLGIQLPGGDIVVVADGTAYPDHEGPVHSVPLLPNHVRVTIDQVIKGDVALPVPFGGHETIGEVEGSNGQWRKDWIVIDTAQVFA